MPVYKTWGKKAYTKSGDSNHILTLKYVISRLKIFCGINQIHPAIEGYLRKNTGFETGKFSSPKFWPVSQPVCFWHISLNSRIYLYKMSLVDTILKKNSQLFLHQIVNLNVRIIILNIAFWCIFSVCRLNI